MAIISNGRKKIKSILFIGNHLSQSGFNISVNEELSVYLVNCGWKTILTSRKVNRFVRLVDMVWTIFSRRRDFAIAEVDVFSGAAFSWGFLCSFLVKALRKPLILTLHGGNLPDYARQHSRRVRKLLSQANVITAPSAYQGQQLSNFCAEIHLIPNGLDIHKYSFRMREKPEPRLIWLRAFHKIYNPSLAPKIIKILNDQNLDSRLIMVGPDKGDGSLQEMLRTNHELGVVENIEVILGIPKENVPTLLNRGDIFINTTNYDNTPVSVIEAMACGLCIVSTNVGGIPYLLEDGVDALLVPPNDPKAMATAVYRILSEPGLAQKLSSNARKKVEGFDWEIVLPQWEELMDELL